MFNLYASLEPLVRASLITTINDTAASHVRLSGNQLSGLCELSVLQGLAWGDSATMTSEEFHSALLDIYNRYHDNQLGDIWSSLKHGVEHVFHEAGRIVKNTVYHLGKAIKQVAPYALGAVAIYFGAPYVMEAGGWIAKESMSAGEWALKTMGFRGATSGGVTTAPSGIQTVQRVKFDNSIPPSVVKSPVMTDIKSVATTALKTGESVVSDVAKQVIRSKLIQHIYGPSGTATPIQRQAYNTIRNNPGYPVTGNAYPVAAAPVATHLLANRGIVMSSAPAQRIVTNQLAATNKASIISYGNKRLLIYGGLGLAGLVLTEMRR